MRSASRNRAAYCLELRRLPHPVAVTPGEAVRERGSSVHERILHKGTAVQDFTCTVLSQRNRTQLRGAALAP